jgi:hypothetical protein
MAKVFPRLKTAKGGAAEKSGKSGAEKVVCTLTGIDTTPENPAVNLEANVLITTGGAGTKQTVRIRRDEVAGTLVATGIVKLGASAEGSVGLQAIDEPGESIARSYVVTVAEAAAEEDTVVNPTLQATY